MALVKCEECGKEISSSAEVCPNCGCPTSLGKERERQKREEEEKKKGQIPTIVLSVISLVLWIMAIYSYSQLDDYDFYAVKYYNEITDDYAKVIFLVVFALAIDIGCFIGKMIRKRAKEKEFDTSWTPMDFGSGSSGNKGGTWTCPSCGKICSNDRDICRCGYSRY